ncbi:hypothetical protein Tco_0792845 [Tanacetum coccineum]
MVVDFYQPTVCSPEVCASRAVVMLPEWLRRDGRKVAWCALNVQGIVMILRDTSFDYWESRVVVCVCRAETPSIRDIWSKQPVDRIIDRDMGTPEGQCERAEEDGGRKRSKRRSSYLDVKYENVEMMSTRAIGRRVATDMVSDPAEGNAMRIVSAIKAQQYREQWKLVLFQNIHNHAHACCNSQHRPYSLFHSVHILTLLHSRKSSALQRPSPHSS